MYPGPPMPSLSSTRRQCSCSAVIRKGIPDFVNTQDAVGQAGTATGIAFIAFQADIAGNRQIGHCSLMGIVRSCVGGVAVDWRKIGFGTELAFFLRPNLLCLREQRQRQRAFQKIRPLHRRSFLLRVFWLRPPRAGN